MNDQFYYVARRAAEFDSPLAALLSVGYTVPAAQLVIDNARLNQSPGILADLGDGKGALLVPLTGTRVELWQAMIGLATEDPSEAEQTGRDLADRLGDGSTIAVFKWDRPRKGERN